MRDMMKLLAEDGWLLKAQKGSHRQLVHPFKPGKVTVNGHPGDDLDRYLEGSIRRQAGLRKEK